MSVITLNVPYKRPKVLHFKNRTQESDEALKRIIDKPDENLNSSNFRYLYDLGGEDGVYKKLVYFLPLALEAALKEPKTDSHTVEMIRFIAFYQDQLKKDGLFEAVIRDIRTIFESYTKDFVFMYYERGIQNSFPAARLLRALFYESQRAENSDKKVDFHNLAIDLLFKPSSNDYLKAAWFVEFASQFNITRNRLILSHIERLRKEYFEKKLSSGKLELFLNTNGSIICYTGKDGDIGYYDNPEVQRIYNDTSLIKECYKIIDSSRRKIEIPELYWEIIKKNLPDVR